MSEEISASEQAPQVRAIVSELRQLDARLRDIASELDVYLIHHDGELSNAVDGAFGNRAVGIDWLLTRTSAFAARPVEMLTSGQRSLVLEELHRIAHGDFS